MRLERYDIDDPSNRDPALIKRVGRWLGPILDRYFRPEVRGLERIPEGAALYVGNHNGGFDTVDTYIFCERVLRERGIDDVPFGLGHEVVFSFPIINQLWAPLGVLRASHDNAHKIFDRGGKVFVYPGGDVDAFRRFSDRNRIRFDGRTGYIRLALRAGVPIVPVVAAGAHNTFLVLSEGRGIARLLNAKRWMRTRVWPIVLSFPWGLTIGPPPFYVPFPAHIRIEALEPMAFDRQGEDAASDDAYVRACADRVENAMQHALTRLSRQA